MNQENESGENVNEELKTNTNDEMNVREVN